jgi:hypothetical protein
MHLHPGGGEHNRRHLLHHLDRRRKLSAALPDRQLLRGSHLLRPERRQRRVASANRQAASLRAIRLG